MLTKDTLFFVELDLIHILHSEQCGPILAVVSFLSLFPPVSPHLLSVHHLPCTFHTHPLQDVRLICILASVHSGVKVDVARSLLFWSRSVFRSCTCCGGSIRNLKMTLKAFLRVPLCLSELFTFSASQLQQSPLVCMSSKWWMFCPSDTQTSLQCIPRYPFKAFFFFFDVVLWKLPSRLIPFQKACPWNMLRLVPHSWLRALSYPSAWNHWEN